MSRTPAVLRQAALLIVIVAATLVVLYGLTAVVGRPGVAEPGSSATLARPPTAPATSPSASGSSAASQAPSASSAPSVAPSPAGDPVLVGAGDIADCASDGDEATAALLDGIAGTVFTAGDNAYPIGSSQTYRDCFRPSWGRHLDRIRPAPGNHDWESGALTAYRDYFGEAASNSDGDPWYAYDLGTWQVIVLDSDCSRVDGCGPESRQGRWLAATLAASDARCALALFHHPRFSSGEHGNDTTVDPLWRALYASGADVIVNGHDHDYERFAPQDPDGTEDRERGIRQFVIGTGGVKLRGFRDPVANSELRASISHGLLGFTLRDGGYDWRFIPTRGDFSDRGTANCH